MVPLNRAPGSRAASALHSWSPGWWDRNPAVEGWQLSWVNSSQALTQVRFSDSFTIKWFNMNPQIRNYKMRFFLPVCQMRNCESENNFLALPFQFLFSFQFQISCWKLSRNWNHYLLEITIVTALDGDKTTLIHSHTADVRQAHQKTSLSLSHTFQPRSKH